MLYLDIEKFILTIDIFSHYLLNANKQKICEKTYEKNEKKICIKKE